MLPALDKAAVAKSFSRAAASYDAVAELQRDVGDKLLAKVPVGRYPNVLDLGCGTGYFTARLAQHAAAETIAGLDIAEGMIAHCRSRATPANALWYRGDAEQLPGNGAVAIFGGETWLGDEPERAVRAALAASQHVAYLSVGTDKAVVHSDSPGRVTGTAVEAATAVLEEAIIGLTSPTISPQGSTRRPSR